MTGVRKAWLVLPGRDPLYLDDEDAGYMTSELDLGYPTPRDVVTNIPGADGSDDETAYAGPRAVSASITAWDGGGVALDDIPALFAPYMLPSARPELHYTLKNASGAERVLTLRPVGRSQPFDTAAQTVMQLQWQTVGSPWAKGVTVNTATVKPGTSIGPGRHYPRTFPQTYPAGSYPAVNTNVTPGGDLPTWPVVRFYGPQDAPRVGFTLNGNPLAPVVALKASTSIAAGDYIEVDLGARTAVRFTASSGATTDALTEIDWSNTVWRPIAPGINYLAWNTAGNTSANSQTLLTWEETYID